MKKCQSCEVIMNEVLKIGVQIDVCPKCLGVWLDKGELEKIIALSETYELHNNNTYRGDVHESFDDDEHYKHHNMNHENHNEKTYYNKHGRPIRKRGGFRDILSDLLD